MCTHVYPERLVIIICHVGHEHVPNLQDLSNRGLGERSNNKKLGSGDSKEGDKTKNSVQVSFTLGKWRGYKPETTNGICSGAQAKPVLLLGNTLKSMECPHCKMSGKTHIVKCPKSIMGMEAT